MNRAWRFVHGLLPLGWRSGRHWREGWFAPWGEHDRNVDRFYPPDNWFQKDGTAGLMVRREREPDVMVDGVRTMEFVEPSVLDACLAADVASHAAEMLARRKAMGRPERTTPYHPSQYRPRPGRSRKALP